MPAAQRLSERQQSDHATDAADATLPVLQQLFLVLVEFEQQLVVEQFVQQFIEQLVLEQLKQLLAELVTEQFLFERRSGQCIAQPLLAGTHGQHAKRRPGQPLPGPAGQRVVRPAGRRDDRELRRPGQCRWRPQPGCR